MDRDTIISIVCWAILLSSITWAVVEHVRLHRALKKFHADNQAFLEKIRKMYPPRDEE